MDMGQPADYLTGMRLYLAHLYETKALNTDSQYGLVGNVLVVSVCCSAPFAFLVLHPSFGSLYGLS